MTFKTFGRLASVSLLLIVVSACGGSVEPSNTEEGWNDRNAPGRFGANWNVRYDRLVSSASVGSTPWSDDYWATRQGGISYRWQTTAANMNYRQYLYTIPSFADQARLDDASLSRLSPSEKYDIVRGNSSMQLTNAERQRTLSSVNGNDVPSWHGLCHGWAPASYMEPQARRAVARTLADGRRVTFYPSDIHALMSRFYGDYHYAGYTKLLGARCENPVRGRSPDVACRDTNPGAMHLAIVHHIATLRTPLVAELDRGVEIWNHPVYGYSFSYGQLRDFRPIMDLGRARFRAPGTAYLVDVRMRLDYATEGRPATTPYSPITRSMTMDYSLELDGNLRIIGGEWLSDSHPDFLWRIERQPQRGDVRAGVDYAFVRALLDEAQ